MQSSLKIEVCVNIFSMQYILGKSRLKRYCYILSERIQILEWMRWIYDTRIVGWSNHHWSVGVWIITFGSLSCPENAWSWGGIVFISIVWSSLVRLPRRGCDEAIQWQAGRCAYVCSLKYAGCFAILMVCMMSNCLFRSCHGEQTAMALAWWCCWSWPASSPVSMPPRAPTHASTWLSFSLGVDILTIR